MIYNTEKTIVGIAQERGRQQPQQNYVTFLVNGDEQEETLSYGELDCSAREIASWLRAKGLQQGDRILIMLPNGIEFVKIFYGCLYGGFIAVPLLHQMQGYMETFQPTLQTSRPSLLIATKPITIYVKERLPQDLKESFSKFDTVTAEEILESSTPVTALPDLKEEDIAYFQFTSGSTGAPKGIMLSHNNLMANMEQSRIFSKWEEGSGTALWLPLFHDFGLAAGLIGALYIGGFVILMTPVHFMIKPFRWLAAMSKYRCASSYAPPFAYEACVKKITEEEKRTLNLSSMRTIVCGAEPVHYLATKEFNDAFSGCGLKSDVVRPGFGMAETVIMFSMSNGLEVLIADRFTLEKEGKLKLVAKEVPSEDRTYLINLGPKMHGHEIVIKDKDNRECPDGKVGEVMICGPSVSVGYFEDEKATQEKFHQKIEGREEIFMGTGDLGLMWEKNLYFSGRMKDLIIIRGRNYYPHDIEFLVGRIEEVVSGGVIAFAESDHESSEHLVIAIEIRADLLINLDKFKEELLPKIDKQVVDLIGQQFQIHPEKRIYIRPGTVKKTSSGKNKHTANRINFQQQEFKGLVTSIVDSSASDEETDLDIATTAKQLFLKIVKAEPILDKAIVDLGGDSMATIEFIEELQEKFPIPGEDLLDQVDEDTTLGDIIEWLTDQQLQNSIPI